MDGANVERSKCALLQFNTLIFFLMEKIWRARVEDPKDPGIPLEGPSNQALLDIKNCDRP
jgi:hypothetical protein